MIIVRRSSSNVNKLQRNILTISTSSSMTSPLPVSASTTTSTCGGGQSQFFDWAYVLSPENKLRTTQILSLDRDNCNLNFKNLSNQDNPEYRKAAVLLPLCFDKNGKPSLLYNLRSLQLTTHRGEISFPGGSLDPEDKGCPIAGAVRETHEELGIHPNDIEIWTTLRMFPTIASNMGVIPVLGFVKGIMDPAKLRINPSEVDHAFTITLEHLCDPKNWEEGVKRKFMGQSYRMPMWKNLNVYSGPGTEEIHLWGLTAFVTHIALLALLPGDVYERKLPYLNLQLKKLKNSPNL